jgi:hypothetical protein
MGEVDPRRVHFDDARIGGPSGAGRAPPPPKQALHRVRARARERGAGAQDVLGVARK